MGKQLFDGAGTGKVFKFPPEVVVIIGLDTEDGPEHELYDEARIRRPLNEGLVRDIMLRGVIQPIVVVRDGNRALVADGVQRTRAAREANRRLREAGATDDKLIMMRAEADKGEPADLLGTLIAANQHRYEDDVLVKASRAARYLRLGGTKTKAAIEYGVSEETIGDWLALLDLDPRVQAAIVDGGIAPSAAVQLSTLPRKVQVETLATLKATGDGRPTVARTKRAIRSVKAGGDGSAPVPPTRSVIRRLVEATEDGRATLDKADVAVLRWVLTGNLEPVPGIETALNALVAPPKPDVSPRRRRAGAPVKADVADAPQQADDPADALDEF